MFENLTCAQNRHTGRASSWDTSGGNADCFIIKPGESRVLADIKGPAQIMHIWCTQGKHYRECLIKITYDNAEYPSVLVPLGDFFGLGHGIVNSYQSMFFSASANCNNTFNAWCAVNAYVPMPFRERAVVEIINESDEDHQQFFYIDYETLDTVPKDLCYFHAEFRRTNPFGGWGDGIAHVDPGMGGIVNKEKLAWDNNYVVLETKGRGHYIGCNLSVSNFYGGWWGEGDDMIWVDGYKWPPDIHGTGTEDLFGRGPSMMDNGFMRCGSSIFEGNTTRWDTYAESMGGYNRHNGKGGYQTCYVQHIENPIRFQKEIKVTIEHGHANHMANDWASTAYWYAVEPTKVIDPPPVEKRMPVLMDNQGNWIFDEKNQCPGKPVRMSDEMKQFKKQWEDDGRRGLTFWR